MLGASLALAARLQSRHGWRIVAMAAVAAVLPDWDGLTILFGAARASRIAWFALTALAAYIVLRAWAA